MAIDLTMLAANIAPDYPVEKLRSALLAAARSAAPSANRPVHDGPPPQSPPLSSRPTDEDFFGFEEE
jgi:hypothetical protein